MSDWVLLDRSVIGCHGPDAEAFLDGLITCSTRAADDGAPAYGGLLTPQGKVIAPFVLWRAGGGFLLDTHPGFAAALLGRLSIYRLRSAVEMALRPDLVVAQGPDDAAASACPGAVAYGPDPRHRALGKRAIATAGTPGLTDGQAEWDERRVDIGVPETPDDLLAETDFWLEALGEEMNGTDFRKGCFVGQETVSRMKRRTPARSKIVRFAAPVGPAARTPVTVEGFQIGRTGSAAGGHVLALVRLDHLDRALAEGTPVMAGGVPLEPRPQDWLIRAGPEGTRV